jgi:uncharacterized membrane protein YsdA (DUF1294 family)
MGRVRNFQPNKFYLPVAFLLILILSAICSLADMNFTYGYLVGVNIVTLFYFGYDKHKARKCGSRIPEFVLHMLTLIGGTGGALVGQQIFEHKTRKRNFRLIFITIVLIQLVCLFAYVATIL